MARAKVKLPPKESETERLLKIAHAALAKDIQHISDAVQMGKLNKDTAAALTQYIKLLNEFRKTTEPDEEYLNNLTEDELKSMARRLTRKKYDRSVAAKNRSQGITQEEEGEEEV